MNTIDIVKSQDFIIDAQTRDDGLIEAVSCNNHTDEQLLFYEKFLDKHDELVEYIPPGPVEKTGVVPEMYRYHKKLKTWFHSPKTQKLFKKKDKQEKTEEE
jgi:hypothetical protein